MGKTMKIWLGYGIDGKREVFKANYEPTHDSHGHIYEAVMGPFRTMRAALITRDYGKGNPHLQTVADAEKVAKRLNVRVIGR